MRFGLAPIQSRPEFGTMFDQARLAEDLGFDVLWAHEHHSGGVMYPSPLMTLAALSGVTTRIALGTNMLLLPLYHPLRVAQDAAMVDVMSGGRLVLGVSAGYASSDLQAFGVSPDARAHRMREGISLIRKVWDGTSVNHESEFCKLHGYTLHPRPMQTPMPPIYMGGTVDTAIQRAARLGDELIISATQKLSDVPRFLGVYEDALHAAGGTLEAKTPVINRVVHVLPDGIASHDALAFFSKGFLGSYDSWGHQNVTGLDDRSRALENTGKEQLIVGEAAFCIDAIKQYQAGGIKEIACLMNFGNPEPEAVVRSLRLFGEKVIPAING